MQVKVFLAGEVEAGGKLYNRIARNFSLTATRWLSSNQFARQLWKYFWKRIIDNCNSISHTICYEMSSSQCRGVSVVVVPPEMAETFAECSPEKLCCCCCCCIHSTLSCLSWLLVPLEMYSMLSQVNKYQLHKCDWLWVCVRVWVYLHTRIFFVPKHLIECAADWDAELCESFNQVNLIVSLLHSEWIGCE